MRPTVTFPGAALGSWRPGRPNAAVVGLRAGPALGGLGAAILLLQARLARRGLRLAVDGFSHDGLVGLPDERPVRVVWLGDSLAVGLGVDVVDDTPARVVARLLDRAVDLRVLAFPGHTSGDVIAQQLPVLENADLVVLCVGANDVARMRSRRSYRRNLAKILAATAPAPTLVLSLPAMAMADRIAEPLRSLVGARARWFEQARVRVIARHGHAVSVDIASRPAHISRRQGRAMLSPDRFHPGAEVYRIWAERIAAACHQALTGREAANVATVPTAD